MTVVNVRIIDQQHEWVYGPSGGRSGQWIVKFQTEGGWQSEVIILDADYTPGNVAAAIAADAANIDAVGSITSIETGA